MNNFQLKKKEVDDLRAAHRAERNRNAAGISIKTVIDYYCSPCLEPIKVMIL